MKHTFNQSYSKHVQMLLHYVVSLFAAPSFATEGRSLPSFQAIAHPSALSSVGVSFFLCFHQTVSNRQRNVLGNSLMCALIGRRSRRPLLTVDHINLNPAAESQSLTGGCLWEVVISVASWPSASDLNRFQSLAGCFHVFILLCLLYVYYWPLIWGLTSSIDSWEVCFLIVVTSPQSSLCRKSFKTNTDLFTSGPPAAAGAIPPSLPTHDWILPLKFPWQPSRKDLMNGHHNLVHLNLRSHIKTQWGSYCEAFSSGEVNETQCRLRFSFFCSFFFVHSSLFIFCFHLCLKCGDVRRSAWCCQRWMAHLQILLIKWWSKNPLKPSFVVLEWLMTQENLFYAS